MLAVSPLKAVVISTYRRPGTWPPQKFLQLAVQSDMQSAKVGDPEQVAWHCCCCAGASQRATQVSFVQTPGSRVPFFKLTRAPTWISFALPSESFIPRRKLTYVATGSSEVKAPSIAPESAAHLSTMFPCASLTSIDMRWEGSEQSSASVTNATTILAPSRRNPLLRLLKASFMACSPCG